MPASRLQEATKPQSPPSFLPRTDKYAIPEDDRENNEQQTQPIYIEKLAEDYCVTPAYGKRQKR